jgi:ABC-2 type transport system ATP-binding protein
MSEFPIEITSLSKVYKVGFWKKIEKIALKPLTLQVRQGEVFGYLGPNGAGKTTTMKMLMGIIFPSSGSARLLGKPISDPECKRQVGFLPEQPYFYDNLTAQELLEYYGKLSGMPLPQLRGRIPEVLGEVGLSDVGPKMRLRKFSKGMLQRIGIAQAILHDPQLIILDEPMSGLDPLGRREVRDLIRGLKQRGKTVFFSTHILSDAEELCDRVAVIHNGELRGVGVVEDLLTRKGNRVEILCYGCEVMDALQKLGAVCEANGNVLRAVVDEGNVARALEAVLKSRANLISVNPAQASLEEYFLDRLRAESPDASVEARA